MSLYGALFSGVSGLQAQSSAMGAISDNITNVSTVGFKGTTVNFQTLVTTQTSATFYSAGGVQSRPRQNADIQGLLQASSSSTDFAVSGQGFFVVNEASQPGISNEFLFTRSGSFRLNDEGFLQNSQGFFLQGWPTDASGNVTPANESLSIANQNIISTDYLESINLNRVGGTAAETTSIGVGANLPATADPYDSSLPNPTTQAGYQKTDVQFFDTLGTANTMSFEYTKTSTANEWNLTAEPPLGVAYATLENASSQVVMAIGQLEFTGIPGTGATVTIGGSVYTFTTGANTTTSDNIISTNGATLAQVVSDLITELNTDFAGSRFAAKDGTATTIIFEENGTGSMAFSGLTGLTISGSTGIATKQGQATNNFTVPQITATTTSSFVFQADGLPGAIEPTVLSLHNFTNGAADFNNTDLNADGVTDVAKIALDFGDTSEANGLTQFGGDFTPIFIQQNGSQFGTFAGVTVDTSGLVTALFDNGETRTVFQIPVATFVNPNGLESRTGNVWNSTEASGDYTLRVADNGSAGQTIQGALEASTVDIGEEFTNMIVVQRAYSAAAKVISTTDEMLEELVRIKR
ncbi:MAG: flagellar hook protein FlgE [Magnetovibrionaceae bacterium]